MIKNTVSGCKNTHTVHTRQSPKRVKMHDRLHFHPFGGMGMYKENLSNVFLPIADIDCKLFQRASDAYCLPNYSLNLLGMSILWCKILITVIILLAAMV
jgi:hypothetical protein